MLIRTARFNILAILLLISVGSARTSWAQDEDPEAEMSEGQDEDGSQPAPPPAVEDPNAVKHGIGLRLRYIFLPKSLIEIFMEEAASGVSRSGFGFDYVRRKADFEFSVGFEYDTLGPDDGFFVERGGSPLEPGTTDFIEFDGLAWYTIDAAFVYHRKLSDLVALRYGGGIGFGIVTGDVIETDAVCVGPDTQNDCVKNNNGAQVNDKQDFFRFPPVLNVVGGVQLTPAKNLAINIELGMRTVFYTGVGAQYFF